MPFLNPLDALGITPGSLPDPSVLKKERRRRLLEFELADGRMEIGGVTVTRSDFARAANELDDPERVRIYHHLQSLPSLGRFLATGDLAYFHRGGREGPVDDAVASFVSPYFAERYGAALASAVRDRDADLIRLLTARPPLVTPADLARADRPVDEALAHIKQDVEALHSDVKAERIAAPDAAIRARLAVSADVLNALPARFAQKRGQIARTVRHLGVAAFNAQDDVKAAYVLLSDATRIDTTPDVAADIAQQLEIVREIRDRRALNEEYEDELEACGDMIGGLMDLTERAESGGSSPTALAKKAREIVDADVVNALPDPLTEVRNQVAFCLRGLSIALWNEHQDAAAAAAVLTVALSLRVSRDTRSKLDDDRSTLTRLQAERRESEKKDVAVLGGLVLMMARTVTQHRGYEVRWGVVAGKLLELFTPDVVALLVRARRHSADEVRGVLQALAPLLAGLQKYARSQYDSLLARLRPLTSTDAELQRLVSADGLAARAQTDAAVRRATSDKALWEHTWFWWAVIIGAVMLLGQCGS